MTEEAYGGRLKYRYRQLRCRTAQSLCLSAPWNRQKI